MSINTLQIQAYQANITGFMVEFLTDYHLAALTRYYSVAGGLAQAFG